MHLALLIPCFNEERTVQQAVNRILATPLPAGVTHRTIVLVNDGSRDNTAALINDPALRPPPGTGSTIHTIHHESNRGKGAAVRTALAAALEVRSPGGVPAELLLIHDADLEYDPADHARALTPIIDGRADAVIGSRFLGDTHRVLYFWHSVANRFITTLSNVFTNLNLTDIECCTKAFSRPVAQQLGLQEDRFGIEPEIVARLSQTQLPAEGSATRPLRIYEVAVSYAGRTYAEGKKITWRDGLAALTCIVKYNLFS